jgi:hypothetical protein
MEKRVGNISADELLSMVDGIKEDARYAALARIASERQLSLEPEKAVGKVLVDGKRALIIPAVDAKKQQQGFLSHRGDAWTLSITIINGELTIPEGFVAKLDQDGNVLVTVSYMTRETASAKDVIGPATYQTSCQYVKQSGFSYSCITEDDIFGEYYTNIYRWGTDPNPTTVAWWACYQGGVHVCPVTEALGSPITWVVCGFPPSHPVG